MIALERLRHLGRRHEIDVVSFVSSTSHAADAAVLEPYVRSVRTVVLPAARSVANVASGALFSPDPLQILYFRSEAFAREVDASVASGAQLVHAFFHRTAPFAFATGLPVVLELMDSLTLRLEHFVDVVRGPRRWLYREELRRMRRYEQAIARRADHVILVSERDRPYVADADVSVIENGVDAEAFAPQTATRAANALVLSGNMGYEPNVDAARWFAREVLPAVRAHVPEATLTIAGARPARSVRELGALPGVTVSGDVDSMPAALNAASVAVVPLRSGSGIQNKVLEAMSCGLPVVTTPVGLGAIEARDGEELLVADGAAPFAEAVVRLLRDPTLRDELGRRARARILARYSWERGAERVEEIWEQVLREPSASRP